MGYEDQMLREEMALGAYKKAVRRKGGKKYAVRDGNGKDVVLSVVAAQKGFFGTVTEATTTVMDREPQEPGEGILYSRSHAFSVTFGVNRAAGWRSVETITIEDHGRKTETPIESVPLVEDLEWHTRLLKNAKRGDVIIYDTGNPEVDGKTKREIKATKRRNK